jgi:anti-sigma factor RsiW
MDMDCASIDLKAVSLGEASAAEKRVAEKHVSSCGACREELARLELTFASLGALRDEEIPKRIAFVSDQVFEPSWWQRLWNSGPQLGFVSAGLLAGALVFHAVYPAAAPPVGQAPLVVAQQQGLTEEQVQRRIDAAVLKAVAQSEKRTAEMLVSLEKKNEMDRQGMLIAFDEQTSVMQKLLNKARKENAGLY